MSSAHRLGQTHAPATARQLPPLVESMVSGDRAGDVGGILANDVNGLCLISKGMHTTKTATTTATGETHHAGVYSSLTRLAATLTPYKQQVMNAGQASNNGRRPTSAPLIAIETDGPSSLLIKEYDGHTVALKVPNRSKVGTHPSNGRPSSSD